MYVKEVKTAVIFIMKLIWEKNVTETSEIRIS